MADGPKIYVDSTCFIDAAKQQIGILPTDRIQDIWFFWKLLEAHRESDLVLFASILSIAECTHADGNMDDKVKGLFTRLLLSGQHVRLVQPTPFIAEDARNLRWDYGVNLSGADYLHVASALDRQCVELLTTDGKMLKAGSKLSERGLRVVSPSQTERLPEKYRQGNLLDDAKITPLPRAKPGAG